MRRIIFPDRVLGRPGTTYEGKTNINTFSEVGFLKRTQIFGIPGKANEQSLAVLCG